MWAAKEVPAALGSKPIPTRMIAVEPRSTLAYKPSVFESMNQRKMTNMIGLAWYIMALDTADAGLAPTLLGNEIYTWLEPAKPEHWRKRKHSAITEANHRIVEKSFDLWQNVTVGLEWDCRLRGCPIRPPLEA